MKKHVLSTEEVARLLHTNRNVVISWCRKGELTGSLVWWSRSQASPKRRIWLIDNDEKLNAMKVKRGVRRHVLVESGKPNVFRNLCFQ
jgi:hypothetical protein